MRIIPRRIEISKLRTPGWKMLYGRRKTGKTFLVEHFLQYDEFFFVGRDGTVYDRNRNGKMSYREFFAIFPRLLNGVVVVDEFHRLPGEFLDLLHMNSGKGELILITSTLWLAKKILLGKGSPLLGIVRPIKISLIDERDILIGLSKDLSGKELIEASTYLREPLLIPYYTPPVRKFLSDFLHDSSLMIKELIGEIFTEEEKRLTLVYEGILKGISNGKTTSTELSSYLFSLSLIEKDNPGILQKYLGILTEMGILRKVEVIGKRRKKFHYYHVSPLFDLHYYLEAKYAYTELDIPEKYIRKVVEEKLPLHVEDFIAELFSKLYGMKRLYIELPNLQLDVALGSFKRIEIVGEVKWKEFVGRDEIRKIEEKLSRIDARRFLVVPSLDALEKEPEGVEVLTPEDILRMVIEDEGSRYGL
ncbi:ATPase [Pyrococcus kukulkanii]|uniref:ATPase n=1 Tax=Pyrococcus kukulkanii TaxID=1609559 RepID=UPI003562E0FD